MTKSYHSFCSKLQVFRFIFALGTALLASSCAYRVGNQDRSLPQGYKQVSIPIFKNYSSEPGVEVSFTNALIKEFERSRIGRNVDLAQAEVVIEGQIKSIAYVTGGTKDSGLPLGSVLATSYDIQVTVGLQVKRRADQAVLWNGEFSRTRSYTAPQVTLPALNTVNPLYNLSARRQNIDTLAMDLMAEAHDRLTEKF